MGQALAEKAAWEFVKELPDSQKFELVVVNPVVVSGPVLSGGLSASQEVYMILVNCIQSL